MIGLQLYTLRNRMEKDFYKALNKVYDYGYEGVEFAGIYPEDLSELKNKLDKMDVKSIGAHESFDGMVEDFNAVIKRHKILNSKYITIPGFFSEDEKEIKKFAKKAQEFAIKAKEEGFEFLYHNHDFEFKKKIDGITMFDYMYKNVPDMDFELDTFWVEFAGIDSEKFIIDHSERIKLLHIKDMKKVESKDYVAVGQGAIDVPKIIEAGKKIGVDTFIVELDECPKDEFETIKESIEYLKKII